MALRSERRFISKNDIQSGMMLDITYKKKSGETKTYTILTIEPSKENQYTKSSQLHGILIDDLSDADIFKLIVSLGNLTVGDDRKAPLTNLQSDDAYSKYKSLYGSQDRYRTFIIENIVNARQILIGELE
jgi:hypothetical protein